MWVFCVIPWCLGSFRDSASTMASIVHACWVSGKYGPNLEKDYVQK